jgi:hypothetical protein
MASNWSDDRGQGRQGRASEPEQEEGELKWLRRAVLPGIFVLAGLGVAGYGAYALFAGLSTNPNAVFEVIAGGCTILSVNVSRWESNAQGYSCYDKYVYHFCDQNSDCYPSQETDKKVCGERCGVCRDRTTAPDYEEGETVECWKPAPGASPAFPYVCGNVACYKMHDPANVALNQVVLGGIIFVVFGLIFGLVPMCILVSIIRDQARRERGEGGGNRGGNRGGLGGGEGGGGDGGGDDGGGDGGGDVGNEYK